MTSPPRKPSPIPTASDYIPMKWVDGHPNRIDKSQKKKELGPQSDFYRPSIGQQIGIDNRYIVLRKLGMGSHSTVCLVKDQLDTTKNAFKVLKIIKKSERVTQENHEVAFLEAIRAKKISYLSKEKQILLDYDPGNQKYSYDEGYNSIQAWREDVATSNLEMMAPIVHRRTARRHSAPPRSMIVEQRDDQTQNMAADSNKNISASRSSQKRHHPTRRHSRAAFRISSPPVLASPHPGQHNVIDYMGESYHGPYRTIMIEPLAFTLDYVLKHLHIPHGPRMSMSFMKRLMRDVTQGIDFLHTEMNIVYAGLKPLNVMITFPHLDKIIQEELLNDPAVNYDTHVNYDTDKLTGKKNAVPVKPLGEWSYRRDPGILDRASCVLTDFGRSHWKYKPGPRLHMPAPISPPEKLLCDYQGNDLSTWNTCVDVWTIGCLVLDILNGECYFQHGVYDYERHLEGIRDAFGLFPKHMHGGFPSLYVEDESSDTGEYLSRGLLAYRKQWKQYRESRLNHDNDTLVRYYNRKYGTNHSKMLEEPPRRRSLVDYLRDRIPTKEVGPLERFLQKCMAIDPKKRCSARELLEEPWIRVETGTFLNLPAHDEHAAMIRYRAAPSVNDNLPEGGFRAPSIYATIDDMDSVGYLKRYACGSDEEDMSVDLNQEPIDTYERELALFKNQLAWQDRHSAYYFADDLLKNEAALRHRASVKAVREQQARITSPADADVELSATDVAKATGDKETEHGKGHIDKGEENYQKEIEDYYRESGLNGFESGPFIWMHPHRSKVYNVPNDVLKRLERPYRHS